QPIPTETAVPCRALNRNNDQRCLPGSSALRCSDPRVVFRSENVNLTRYFLAWSPALAQFPSIQQCQVLDPLRCAPTPLGHLVDREFPRKRSTAGGRGILRLRFDTREGQCLRPPARMGQNLPFMRRCALPDKNVFRSGIRGVKEFQHLL